MLSGQSVGAPRTPPRCPIKLPIVSARREKSMRRRIDVGLERAVREAACSKVRQAGGNGATVFDQAEASVRTLRTAGSDNSDSRAVASDGVVDIFDAAGLKKPDISIMSDEFLADVRNTPQRNLAVELLQRLLKNEIKIRGKRNVAEARSFAELLERSLRNYQNRAIESAQVIEQLIQLAKDIRAAAERGEKLGLTEDELAFYDALGVGDSAVQVLGDNTLKLIGRELVEIVRKNVSIDCGGMTTSPRCYAHRPVSMFRQLVALRTLRASPARR